MNKPTRFYSKKQETSVAKAVSGVKTANSGATAFSKGDVRTDAFLIECKTKTSPSKSIRLERDWFDKLDDEAFAMGRRYSALAFDFGDGQNRYVVSERLFKKLLEVIEGENEIAD